MAYLTTAKDQSSTVYNGERRYVRLSGRSLFPGLRNFLKHRIASKRKTMPIKKLLNALSVKDALIPANAIPTQIKVKYPHMNLFKTTTPFSFVVHLGGLQLI